MLLQMRRQQDNSRLGTRLFRVMLVGDELVMVTITCQCHHEFVHSNLGRWFVML